MDFSIETIINMKNKITVQFRYMKTDFPWFDIYNKGEWIKWKAYKKQVDAEQAIISLRKNKPLPWQINNPHFEFRIKPNEQGE